MVDRRALGLVVSLLALGSPARAESVFSPDTPAALDGAFMRGVTIGPIESALHPGRGYGSPAFERGLDEAVRLGATWISLTPFGRVWNLKGTGVDRSFELPVAKNERALQRAVRQAHARGLKVLLVPHLWVESGEWRGELDPETPEDWRRFAESYRAFVLGWARFAERARVDMLAAGVELRSWVTTTHAPSFFPILRDIRGVYSGLLTYAGNWDDIEQTVILSEVDVIGINAFYPLTDKPNASDAELVEGGLAVGKRVEELAQLWQKPVMFNEFGYTARADPALRPWEWPDHMSGVTADARAQGAAYRGLLSGMRQTPALVGGFAWRLYADPDDLSQEAEWGFSPRGREAELWLRHAYWGRFASDTSTTLRGGLFGRAPEAPGVF